MPTTSIKISQLDPISSLTGEDFLPIDQSSSIKTYRANLSQLQSLFSTGSFLGSMSGSLTGSLTGSLVGRITGTGTSPQFVGTSSWAISSSNTISASYSDVNNSSSYALSASRSDTASFVLNGGDLSGAGTLNYIPIWTGNKTLGSTSNFYYESGYFTSTQDLKIIKNAPAVFVTGSGGGYVAVRSAYNSTLFLQSAQSSSRDNWALIVNADGANDDGPAPYDIRGTLNLTSISGSSQFVSKQVTNESTPITYVLKSRSNGLYFWPEFGAQSLSRDGTFNIGVDASNPNTNTRLKIQVYSGSSASNPQTYHLGKAIEVTYGSSSLNTTFCVSSSGQVTAAGYSGSNYNLVSFYGSASYAISSSNAFTSSYALSSSISLTASYLDNTSTNPLGILENTSSLTANNYKGGSYTFAHSLGVTPKYFKCVLVCYSTDSTAGYLVNDEVDSVAAYDSSGNNEHTAITSWSNSTNLGASCLNNGWIINKKSDGSSVTLDPALWKIKFYYR